MEALSPMPALAAFLLAMATATLLARQHGAPAMADRYASIDGLRGYLAFAVFVHHASIWYLFAQTGRWALPPSRLYTHLGQSSVALFFMITGFLFFSKLIDGHHRPVDWTRLLVSRFTRLVPLYLVAIGCVLLCVFWVSGWTLREPLTTLAPKLLSWLAFTIRGAPDLNGVQDTPRIIAWVTWSLPYEWFFYLSLPAIALCVGILPPPVFLLLGLIFGWACLYWMPSPQMFEPFLGGIAAALCCRSPRCRAAAQSPLASLAVVVLLVLVVVQFAGAYNRPALALLGAAFILIACGNSIFGWLHLPASRFLGETAYSMYLLHGILLFGACSLGLGVARIAALSPLVYWLGILLLVPVLVTLCYWSFRWIEQPGMNLTPTVTRWLKQPLTVARRR